MKKIITLLITLFYLINVNAQCWSKISTGNQFTVALKTDGSLWGWGFNTLGQLGDGTNTSTNTPGQVGAENNWAVVSAGGFHTLAIKTDGTLWAWGNGGFGQLGTGNTININTPVQAGTDNDWDTVVSGQQYFSLALKVNGTLWGWGQGLGINSTIPVQIGTDNNWASISASSSHVLAIKKNGTLWAWGSNSFGELGDGTKKGQVIPVQIGTGNDWAAVSAGGTYNFSSSYSLALKTNGTLWSWGSNYFGQLGDGTNNDKNVPGQIGAGTSWVNISAGGGHTLAIMKNGTIWAWGYNYSGQLGDGTNIDRNMPVQTGADIDWNDFFAGEANSFAIKSNNSLWAWGISPLGDGTNTSQNTPFQIICGVLPIKLVTFTGQQYLHISLLNWQTTNEINTSHFIVQHSVNSTTFNNIGRVEARNTSGTHDYSFTDGSPVDGVNFYRLQMVDIDSKTTYSSIIKILFTDKIELQVFPNPAKNTITVSGLENKGTIKIISVDGKVVKQLSAKAGSMLLDISTLTKGIYILQYNNENKTEQLKIIKQ